MTEQLKNSLGKPTSTLDGFIDAAVTTLDLAAGTGVLFPSTGDFRIRIDNEILIVTARASDTLTVTRGAETTTAAVHLDESEVNLVVTAGALEAKFATVEQIADLDSEIDAL